MVFAPTRDFSGAPTHDPAAAPKRREHLELQSERAGPRLRWRAVVHMVDRDHTVRTTWHLVGCAAPEDPSAHCPKGQQDDPDGHCLIDGHCARCGA
jgi:hypothetical protein